MISCTLLLALLASSGCSLVKSTIAAYEIGPNGISRPEFELREALVHSDFTTLLAASNDDALLRTLTVGASTYYANQFERSAGVLDSAAAIADDRITKSVSREALALVSSELALSYRVRRTERLFIPYYAMLAYARLDRWEDAAVEARRVSALLAQYAPDVSDGERSTHAMLHSLAAVVFERAGDGDDAKVAYRLARAMAPTLVDSMQPPLARGQGEVVVVVERGFVAYRTTESINVFVGGADTLHNERHRPHADEDDDGGYWLSIAFPALRHSPATKGTLTVRVDSGAALVGASLRGNVDDAAAADEARERVSIIARATARAALKYAATKAAKDAKGDAAGEAVNLAGSLLERADVRSWSMLPQTVSLVRLRLPAGVHHLTIQTDGYETELGAITVVAGQSAVVTTRLWTDPVKRLRDH